MRPGRTPRKHPSRVPTPGRRLEFQPSPFLFPEANCGVLLAYVTFVGLCGSVSWCFPWVSGFWSRGLFVALPVVLDTPDGTPLFRVVT